MDVKTMKKERDVLSNRHEAIELAMAEIEMAMDTIESHKLLCAKMELDKPQNKYEEAFVLLWNAYLKLTE